MDIALGVTIGLSQLSEDSNAHYLDPARWHTARLLAILCLALLPTFLVQTPGRALTTESYTSSYLGINPKIYYPRLNDDGPSFTAPTTVSTEATINTIDVDLGFTVQPTGMYYQAFLCAGTGANNCADVSPAGSFKYDAGWTNTTAAFAGYPVSTRFHFMVRIADGGSGSTIPPLNPYRNSRRQNATVTYSY